jgi:hypothetical protein
VEKLSFSVLYPWPKDPVPSPAELSGALPAILPEGDPTPEMSEGLLGELLKEPPGKNPWPPMTKLAAATLPPAVSFQSLYRVTRINTKMVVYNSQNPFLFARELKKTL